MRSLDCGRLRVITVTGATLNSLSPHAGATLEADRKAFAMLMRHLREVDRQRTVILVHVQNEPGTYGSVRDYSPSAEKLFKGTGTSRTAEEARKKAGTWQQVFAANAEEFFHAWSVAHFIEQVAAAGKAEYPLPMYVNVALRDPVNPASPAASKSSIWVPGARLAAY